ncbi:hypothetical protein SP292_004894 [Escherichia coli]|nr:hypothetical protein [Escherichia coli]
MGVLSVAVIALLISLWHEFNRFPATGSTLVELIEKVSDLENENEELREKINLMEEDLLSLTDYIDRLKDPEYYSLLDAGDGYGLHELEKSRGEL